jgi:hypothetical protein
MIRTSAYAIAFATRILFNLVHLVLIGGLVWRQRLRTIRRPAYAADGEWNQEHADRAPAIGGSYLLFVDCKAICRCGDYILCRPLGKFRSLSGFSERLHWFSAHVICARCPANVAIAFPSYRVITVQVRGRG